MKHIELLKKAAALQDTLRDIANRGTIEDGRPFDGYADTVGDLFLELYRYATKEE